MSAIRATPLHGRTAALNPCNRWTERNGFTLARDFGDASAEALAARTTVMMADISWRWRVFIEGARAAEFLSRLVTRKVAALAPGESVKALWLNDGGAVRGAGVVARFASDKFLLISAATDIDWIASAAALYDVSLRDVTEAEAGIAIAGPYAKSVLDALGIDPALETLRFRKLFSRRLDITLSCWGELAGYELWCAGDDSYLLWDALAKTGVPFGMRAAGLDATDILDIEAGILRPHRDYRAAVDGFASEPVPASLGLESLIDEAHMVFNGRPAWLANRSAAKTSAVGIEIDSETPAPFAPLLRNGVQVGHTMTSVASPFLRRAIALAQVDASASAPGTELQLPLPLSLNNAIAKPVRARVIELPFTKPPAPSTR